MWIVKITSKIRQKHFKNNESTHLNSSQTLRSRLTGNRGCWSIDRALVSTSTSLALLSQKPCHSKLRLYHRTLIAKIRVSKNYWAFVLKSKPCLPETSLVLRSPGNVALFRQIFQGLFVKFRNLARHVTWVTAPLGIRQNISKSSSLKIEVNFSKRRERSFDVAPPENL